MKQTSTPLTIQELTFKIKNQLETNFCQLQIVGEISNFKKHSSGHLYFDLKDAEAKISAVMFKRQSDLLKQLPKEGDKVVVTGSVTVYPPHGKYQLLVTSMQSQGIGNLLLQFEELKQKLKAKGWFDPEHKKPLPLFPKTIGVVTSPTGAVIRDIIHVLRRRHHGFHLILNPVRVQGEGAAQEIATAIQEFNKYKNVDVIIVGRGGGSLEDLWCFNEESTAEAIFQSDIPIISAVGHETDTTLADFVADVRAPTPSAAAEIVTAEKNETSAFLIKSQQQMHRAIQRLLITYKEKIAAYKRHPLLATPLSLVHIPLQRIEEFQHELQRASERTLLLLKERLVSKEKQLLALNPKNVLKRGYTILFAEKENGVIHSAKKLYPEQVLSALFSDGKATLKVIDHE